jgi:multisubunit Na+/H+ antiporter MnhE subunit
MPGPRHRMPRWAVSWVVCMGLWLLLTSTTAPNDVLTGALAAALAATAAAAVDAVEPVAAGRARVPVGWFLALPVRVVADTWRVTVALARDLAGRPVEGRLIEVAGAPREPGVQAVGAVLTTISPNRVLVDFDDAGGIALVHELVARPAGDFDDVVART